jgi:hypothetical protein
MEKDTMQQRIKCMKTLGYHPRIEDLEEQMKRTGYTQRSCAPGPSTILKLTKKTVESQFQLPSSISDSDIPK